MAVSRSAYGHCCPKCGYIFGKNQAETIDETCPKCGIKIGKWKAPSLLRAFAAVAILLVIVSVFICVSLWFTNREVAIELRQIQQPMANRFYVGIDVSGTIRPETLADIRKNLISRLRKFIGQKTVSYSVALFGTPGCGRDGILNVLSTGSPDTPVDFRRDVERKIKRIAITKKPEAKDREIPLTTPLYCLLDKVLKERPGGRIIIFSDLVNDEYGCDRPYRFPLEAINTFGKNKDGQIIFFYTAPYTVGAFNTTEIRAAFMEHQETFIRRMKKLGREGTVRVSFNRIPEEPGKRAEFIAGQLTRAIPATTFEVVWERVSRLLQVIVAGIRA